MAHCNADPSCVGFTTDASMSLGFLKSSVAITQPSAGVDLFVKHSLPSPSRLTLMPLPNSIQLGNESVLVASPVDGFSMLLQSDSADLRAAVARYLSLTFPEAGSTLVRSASRVLSDTAALATSLAVLNITVQDLSAPLLLGVDESYTLAVPADGSPATLSAGTFYGALRGLESFSQLVQFDYNSGLYFIPSAPILIADAPAFPYRGMMIDTSAHFVPVPVLRHLIDSMAFAKLNVLHWHIVDQASFPIQSQAYPQLWNSAWSPRERYTLADAAALVEYGRQRGVLIVPEQDNPSHADAICLTYPEACTFASCQTWTNPLNPAVNASYALVEAVMREWQAVFPSGIMHQGGDELDTDCWLQDPNVAAWLTANNMTTLDAYRYWVGRTHTMASQLNQTVMRWQVRARHAEGSALLPAWLVHRSSSPLPRCRRSTAGCLGCFRHATPARHHCARVAQS
jgi:hexosaminidase